DKYVGCLIGRNANRIKNGSFALNGKTYQLNLNAAPNHLHGGFVGFNKRVFDETEVQADTLTLHYLSPHKEENYPGNLDFSVTYTLDEDSLILRYHGLCDKRTLFNPTHHSYFNLSGEPSIKNHELSLDSDRFAPLDADGLGLYPPHKAVETMDFKRFVKLSDRLSVIADRFPGAKGLDHHFERRCDDQHPFIRLRQGRRNLSVTTNSPGAQVYSGNYLDGKIPGKAGFLNVAQAGICCETQFYPDNINNEAKIKGIVEAFEPKELTTQWRFYLKEG
ncbi:MAG: galactose mutarotase, partial [Erysipelotrichales bacterium]